MQKYIVNKIDRTVAFEIDGNLEWAYPLKDNADVNQTIKHLNTNLEELASSEIFEFEIIEEEIKVTQCYDNKRHFEKKTAYVDFVEVKAQIWSDGEGNYLEVFFEDEEENFETICYSKSVQDNEHNNAMLLKELKKLVKKYKAWVDMDIDLVKEVVTV